MTREINSAVKKARTAKDTPTGGSARRVAATVNKLVKAHGTRLRADIKRGVNACARVWDFARDAEEFDTFCRSQYVPPKRRKVLMARLDEFHHSAAGSLRSVQKIARAGQDIADRPLLAAESVLAPYAPENHLSEDYRTYRIAALAQLNFGTDDTRPPRTRAGWAERRLADVGRDAAPAEILTRRSQAEAKADRFIASYNLHLDRYDFGDSRVKFPAGTRLVAHWGLRDYLTSLHGKRHALAKQRAILGLMERVVEGEVPREVLDNPSVGWDIPGGKISAGGRTKRTRGHGPLRWEIFNNVWQIQREIDPYRRYGNFIDEKFLVDRELPESKVVGILEEIISSPLAERVARYLRDKLGRELEPFDIYYRDFSPAVGKSKLGYDVRKRYPTAAALQEAIPGILVKLGWKRDRARWIGSKIRVDNGRSAGHAWPPHHDKDVQLLRVRVERGCDEINFSTFMHELGHCVEGVLTSYEMDYKALWGVPNTAFTEGFAFTFEDRTDQILQRKNSTPRDAVALQRFWEPFEIAGSALTEIRLYHWLYDHSRATPAQIMKAVRRIGDELWAEYYARIFGPDSHGLLAVYSHMLWGDFYLAEYPMGYVIAYQVRKHLSKQPLPAEMERICAQGSIYPEQWMQGAVGSKISAKPLLDDTARALKSLGY